MLKSRFKGTDSVIEIGIDEAGRGSFWGPIMAGAVIIPDETTWTDKQRNLIVQLRDSKKISPKKRERIADEIKELIPLCAIGIVNADEINENGITWANMEAFRRAVYNLQLKGSPEYRLLIDGTLPISDWNGEQHTIIEGDNLYYSIAGASILAKVSHDRWIKEYCDKNPECNERYSLYKSKGYGTALHREGIKTHGGHELHRLLYIQNWLPESTHNKKQNLKTRAKNNITDIEECLIKFI
jgi:ribonuclease HII